MIVRKAHCAGTWYPTEKSEISRFLNSKVKKQKAIAGICPHAGWIYSGKIAGEVYSRMEPASIYILVGPNHYGMGSAISVYNEGEWETPLGGLEVNREIANSIVKTAYYVKSDKSAHSREHSLEVQLPFIKLINKNATIVPITMSDYSAEICRDLGENIAGVIKENKLAGKTVLIASTDMSHYLEATKAKELDDMAIKQVLNMNPEGLIKTVEDNDISMCGYGPTAVVLWAAKKLGAAKSELISYGNSGDATKDYAQVVGYAGIIVS